MPVCSDCNTAFDLRSEEFKAAFMQQPTMQAVCSLMHGQGVEDLLATVTKGEYK